MSLQKSSVRFYHNILWSRYKGIIFSRLYAKSSAFNVTVEFVQIAETGESRITLGGVDLSLHRYPYELLFAGSYERIPWLKRLRVLISNVISSRSELIVLPGYHRAEYWAMLVICILLRRKRAVFCDSTAYETGSKQRWKEKAKAMFFKKCDGFFCYGIRSKQYVESYGIDSSKIFRDCQAAALTEDYDPGAVLRHHVRTSEDKTPVSYLYVGRLSVEKGLVDLIMAFHAVCEILPEARLVIIGAGPLSADLRTLIDRFALQEKAVLAGTRTPAEIGDLLLSSSTLVLPSYKEPWGLVVNEALSYGCPVVVSDSCGCVPELVHEGETGHIFPAGDVFALRDAMIKSARFTNERAAVAERCLKLIGRYTPEAAAVAILQGCRSVLGAEGVNDANVS